MVIEGDYQVQVELRTQTGIPSDNIINTFAFQWTGIGAPDFQALSGLVDEFYDDIGETVLSNVLSSGSANHQIKIYDLTDPSPPTARVHAVVHSGGRY